MKKIVAIILSVIIIVLCTAPISASAKESDKSIYRYALTALKNVNDSEKVIYVYNRLVEEMPKLSERIDFDKSKGITKDILQLAFDAYVNDYPECFWFDCNGYSTVTSSNAIVAICPKYLFDTNTFSSALRDLEIGVEDALSVVKSDMTDLEKEKAIHDYLAQNVEYGSGENADLSHTIYGSLVYGTAVCDGYSKAFSYLCNLCGIDCLIVTGQSVNPMTGEPEEHAWNIVKSDGNWYYVDSTWDTQDGCIFYKYFNATNISDTHLIDMNYSVPTVNSSLKAYYEDNSIILDTLDVKAISDLLKANDYEIHFVSNDDMLLFDWLIENDQANFSAIVTELNIYGRISLALSAMENEYYFALVFQRSVNISGKILGIDNGETPKVSLFDENEKEIPVTVNENGEYSFGPVDVSRIDNNELIINSYYLLVECEGYADYFSVIQVNKNETNADISLVKQGDINGDGKVDNLDLVRLKKYLAGYNVLINYGAANINGDVKDDMHIVDNLDLILLKKLLVK